MVTEKLHKVLANTGLGSRRQIEKYIADGRVTVNGEIAHVGMRVDQGAQVLFDGSRVELPTLVAARMLMYHKPLGEISTRSDPQGRPTVFDRLPAVAGRWISVGRLDINTTGLLLFTNNGGIADRLMHPSSNLQREYLARVRGVPTAAQLSQLKTGISLDGHTVCFRNIEQQAKQTGRNRWFRVTVDEGRYREVRRLWEAIGCQVSQLKRVRFGSITLPRDLSAGAWRELDAHTVEVIRKELGLKVESSG